MGRYVRSLVIHFSHGKTCSINYKVVSMNELAVGRGNKVVDLKEITDDLISSLKDIRKKGGSNTRIVNQKESRLSVRIIRDLSASNESQKLKIETYNRYMTRLRTKVRESGFKNVEFEKKCLVIAEKETFIKEDLIDIATSDYYQAKDKMKILIERLESESSSLNGKEKKNRDSLVKRLNEQCLLKIDSAILKKLVRTKVEHEDINEKAKERVDKYSDSSKDTVFDYKGIAELIPRLLTAPVTNDGWQLVALGIALATGRRQYEAIYLSTFEVANGRNIKITGFAKKKAGESNNKAITIPCLADPKLVIAAVKRLRESDRITALTKRMNATASYDEQNEILNNSAHKQLNECSSEILKPYLTDTDGQELTSIPFKLSRDIYINCAFIEYRLAGGQIKQQMFIKEQLNHVDIKTSINYMKMHPKEDVSKSDVKQVKAVKAKFVDRSEERINGLNEIFKLKAIKDRKPFLKALEFVIEKTAEDKNYVISTYNLRNAIPSEESKSGFKAIMSTPLIGDFVKIIKSKGLDQPL